jgi:hypothetical protein
MSKESLPAPAGVAFPADDTMPFFLIEVGSHTVFRDLWLSEKWIELKRKEKNQELKKENPDLKIVKADHFINDDVLKEATFGETDEEGNIRVLGGERKLAAKTFVHGRAANSKCRLHPLSMKLKPEEIATAQKEFEATLAGRR